MFLTDLIFAGCCGLLFNCQMLKFIQSGFFQTMKGTNFGFETVITISAFAILYEIGLVINRIDSLIEDLLRKSSVILPFDNDYRKFNKKKKYFQF